MRFFLGTHRPAWLGELAIPLFVSRRTLSPIRRLPRALAPWALDSGGFTELSLHGQWTVSPATYAAEVRRFRDEIGSLEWAAPQDWMCEPAVRARTGLSVEQHQERTVANLLELRAIAPDVPWVPVLQGWSVGSYLHHIDDYARAGVDLAAEPLVGVGTVCRRQATLSASLILGQLASEGLRLHGFGLKKTGLAANASRLASADSLAWSLNARRNPPMPGCAHASCANCQSWALLWRDELLASLPPHAPAGAPMPAGAVLPAGALLALAGAA